MKRIIAITMILCVLLSVCACDGSTDDRMSETDTQDTSVFPGNTDNITDKNGDQSDESKTTYLSSAVMDRLEQYFTDDFYYFTPYSPANAPYTVQDVYTVSDTRILSVTLPIYKVGKADSGGNYKFTLFVMKNSLSGLKSAAVRKYTLQLNGKDFGFTDGLIVNRFVRLDLSSIDLTLSNGETLAWFSSSDTVIPAYIPSSSTVVKSYMEENAPYATGYFQKLSNTGMTSNTGTLVVDFEFEDVRVDREEYRQLVAKLKEKYSGKYVSVIGDSISTFTGYSNNSSYNSTTGANEVWYSGLDNVASWRATYWGRLINDLDMKLCVNNSRSGKTVYGLAADNYKDSSMLRATELDNDNGTPSDPTDDIIPDVILMYMGINDTSRSPFGDLYDLLKSKNVSEHETITKEWFEGVLKATNNGENIVQGSTVTTTEQAYALTVYKMMQAYPDAEVYCLTFVDSESKKPEDIAKWNICIKAIASTLGATVVDQFANNGVSAGEYHAYGVYGSGNYLHPNPSGFYRMTLGILKAMSKEHK